MRSFSRYFAAKVWNEENESVYFPSLYTYVYTLYTYSARVLVDNLLKSLIFVTNVNVGCHHFNSKYLFNMRSRTVQRLINFLHRYSTAAVLHTDL